MFNFWQKWIDKKVQQKLDEKKAIEEEARKERERQEKILAEQKERERLEFERQLEEKRLLQKESDEPYIEIVSDRYIQDKGLEIKLDWNIAMINYLKQNGFTGNTEEDIVYSYLRAIAMENQKAEIANTYLTDVSDT